MEEEKTGVALQVPIPVVEKVKETKIIIDIFENEGKLDWSYGETPLPVVLSALREVLWRVEREMLKNAVLNELEGRKIIRPGFRNIFFKK